MKVEILPKRYDTTEQGQFRKRRRPKMDSLEHCMKKCRWRKKVQRKGQQRGSMEEMTKVAAYNLATNCWSHIYKRNERSSSWNWTVADVEAKKWTWNCYLSCLWMFGKCQLSYVIILPGCNVTPSSSKPVYTIHHKHLLVNIRVGRWIPVRWQIVFVRHVGPGTDCESSRLSCWIIPPWCDCLCIRHVVLCLPDGNTPFTL